jgi:hypothetical protein
MSVILDAEGVVKGGRSQSRKGIFVGLVKNSDIMRKYRSFSLTLIVLAIVALGGAIVATGCGGDRGGGTTSTDGNTNTNSTATNGNNSTATNGNTTSTNGGGTLATSPRTFIARISWGPRTRVVGLTSAQSARATYKGAGLNGQDVSVVVNRNDGNLAAHETSKTSAEQVQPGNHDYVVTFYSQRDGGGQQVGSARAGASLLADGNLSTTIATYGGVRKVTIQGGQTVPLGSTSQKDLVVTAMNELGDTLALESQGGTLGYGAVQWIVTPSADGKPRVRVNADGSFTGLRPGTVQVRAKVDDQTSDPIEITVTSPVQVTGTPANTDPLGWENTLDLTAVVTGLTNDITGSDRNVTWKIRNDTGGGLSGVLTVSGTNPNKATYLAPRTTGEQTFFVVATSNYDPLKEMVFKIVVKSIVKIAIAPGGDSVFGISARTTQQFTATVTNGNATVDQTVTWQLVGPAGEANAGEKYGRLSRQGLYTAPATPPAPDGKCKIIAISNYDPSTRKELIVKVVAGGLTVIID